LWNILIIYRVSKPHAYKPFPGSLFDNSYLKPRHVFVFDVLCRHIEAEEDGWIMTNSKELINLVREHNGIKIEAVTPCVKFLQQYGYIELVHNDGYRSVLERAWAKTDYEIRILDSAWDSKVAVRNPLKDPAIRRERTLAKKASANL
jgi:hypothetical protein